MKYSNLARRLILITFITYFCVSNAKAEPFEVTVAPIIGYEQVQQVLPTPHTTTRIFYGGVVTAGVLLISAEAQYTRATNQETFPSLTQTNTGDRIKAGLRSGFRLGSLISLFIRGGVEASQEKNEQAFADGTTSTTYTPVRYRPYAGAGAKAKLTNKIYATADVVTVIPNVNDLSQNEYQVTAGFVIKFP